jgi:hypothetical protein
MKFMLIFALLCSSAFAIETKTDCAAMDGSREKVVKEGSVKKGSSSSLVIRQ